MHTLYSAAEISKIEKAALAELPPYTLMQRAGEACARLALRLIENINKLDNPHILILAGPGNNGGDALEAAVHLSQFHAQISVVLYADPLKQPPDAHHALERARQSDVVFLDISTLSNLHSHKWALVIDGLFGIGLTRPISGALCPVVEYVKTLTCPVLAIDAPSGLDVDTGTVVGNNESIAIRASHTLTLIGDKIGLHTCDGPDYSGHVTVDTLDIAEAQRALVQPRARLNTPMLFQSGLKPRQGNTHKGSYGDVIIVGGAHGMTGAPMLAARMAAHAGSGRVFVAFVGDAPAYDSVHPELMIRQIDQLDFDASSVVIGPGLGTSPHARDIVSRALQTPGRLVIDADALNLIASDTSLLQALQNRPEGSSIITPHPLEAGRLLATNTVTIQSDRAQAARQLAQQCNSIAILKGAGTVIAMPDGAIVVNPTGNPALSTAGTGDVLAGLCGALLAQGWPANEAAMAAVWLHGKAADELVEMGIGPVGMTASEIIPAVRMVLNRLIREYTNISQLPRR